MLSLLKNLSGLGIDLPMKLVTDAFSMSRIEHWRKLRFRRHAWVLSAVASERYSCKNEWSTAQRAPMFGRHSSSRGATFVAMMQTTNLRERNNLACRGRLYVARLRTIFV